MGKGASKSGNELRAPPSDLLVSQSSPGIRRLWGQFTWLFVLRFLICEMRIRRWLLPKVVRGTE